MIAFSRIVRAAMRAVIKITVFFNRRAAVDTKGFFALLGQIAFTKLHHIRGVGPDAFVKCFVGGIVHIPFFNKSRKWYRRWQVFLPSAVIKLLARGVV